MLYYTDVDECAMNQDSCTYGCVNTEGTYYCTCTGGYELTGDNKTCIGEFIPSIYSQASIFYENKLMICCVCIQKKSEIIFCYSGLDINECTEVMDDCTHRCVNTKGSYYCTCHSGYELRKDNITCSGELMSNHVRVERMRNCI